MKVHSIFIAVNLEGFEETALARSFMCLYVPAVDTYRLNKKAGTTCLVNCAFYARSEVLIFRCIFLQLKMMENFIINVCEEVAPK